jgi:prepilin-type N-terminal cleavage/methylation domain-containing protein/prepilin-type processing-associated H-X9-DG protein
MKAPLFRSRRHDQGFTLVELLTVIAIIGILGAIILAVFGNVRESSRKSLCASNLRQNGMAMIQYAAEHKGVFPAADSGSSIFSKALIDGGYLPKRLETWTCPTHLANDEQSAAMVMTNDPDRYPRSYAICGTMLSGGSTAYSKGINMNNIVNPANTVMLADLHGFGPGVMRQAITGAYQGGATFERDRMRAAAAKATSPWNTSFHADGARNFVFTDGHVVFMTAQEANQDKYWPATN